jgi:NAD(P)-dependent dehydrogenase (short-subunit alcohol dehydrogenase family)
VKLDGRVVVVTGAAGGIGRALALRCASEGARVAVTDVQADRLRGVGDELGAGHLAIACDVTDAGALDALLGSVEDELGPVDVFFANAGVAIGEDPIETPDEVWDRAFAVNFHAHRLAARYGERGVRVSCLCPMGVRTAMTQGDELAHRVVRSAGAMLEPEEVADVVVAAIDREQFLILPHPEVLTFFQRKGMDYDRWLAGMRRLRASTDAGG